MCGIIGVFNRRSAFDDVKKGLLTLKSRGLDGSGYFDSEMRYFSLDKIPASDSESILAHNLHSIVGNVPQPIKLNKSGGVISANCEIYNWKDLGKGRNDAEVLLKLLDSEGITALDKLRGVYAFGYWKDDKVMIARDILGIKPLWYSTSDGFSFASEKKALDMDDARELNPREILIYDIRNRSYEMINRKFFDVSDEVRINESELSAMIEDAVRIRVPDTDFGLLFSGGIDSVIIASILKKTGRRFRCYIAAFSENSPDVAAAKKAAEMLDLDLKVIISDDVAHKLERVVPLIEDSNVIKVGVGLTMFIAAEAAAEDGVRVLFSGSGADELFAGYKRYKDADPKTLNKDCYSDILKIYEKNTYRDDIVTMNNRIELRVPFLDRKLADTALKIPPEQKIHDGTEKYILRKAALAIGIPEELAFRKKKAAQYGSGFDKAIGKLARAAGKSKSEYLAQFLGKKILRLGAMISSGKDGLYAADIMQRQNYSISCFMTMKSKNRESYMFHTPNVDLVRLQAESADIPLLEQETTGKKESELDDLKSLLEKAKARFGIEGVITGAIFSNYQRERIEKVCDSLGLKIFSPLWHMDQALEMTELIRRGFSIVFSSIQAFGLDRSWLGKKIAFDDVEKLKELNKKYGLNIAGEGGEFESLVLDCPMFSKKISIDEHDIIEEDENTAFMVVKKASLVQKEL